jgi:hypothetical protein
MLDKDIAKLYDVKPRRLREQVNRNKERFPESFCFQLAQNEVEDLVSQFATPSKRAFGGHLPYAFTEHGVLMTANVLRSKHAIAMSIRIIEVFVRLREIMLSHKDLLQKLDQLERKVTDHDVSIQAIFQAIKTLLRPEPSPRKKIGFKRSNE